jgi:hypothetical protein
VRAGWRVIQRGRNMQVTAGQGEDEDHAEAEAGDSVQHPAETPPGRFDIDNFPGHVSTLRWRE